ncbi:ISAs1 family transposase [Hymenobacter sp. IS2118]|uniref:ISAs1 family transposase n=2 Tax=Hymenobacter TaxID=89966 RepID=UPI000556CDE9|nr:ISAs1 family transposase [Hymenobacter sp. IS2118]
MSLLTHLADVPDFRRQNKNFRHKLLDILVISVLAVLSGADDFEEIAWFGQQKEPVFRRYLSLDNGIPSDDTFRRVFQHLDAAAFNAAFLAWMRQVLPADQLGQVCIDGKTLRGSGPQALHVVSAVASAQGLSLAQVATAGKGHELAAIPDVLALLDVRGCLVSLDALSCQPAIAAQICQQGGDYLLALKENQATLLAEAERALAQVPARQTLESWSLASHNTPLCTQVSVQTDLRWVDEEGRWPGLAALVRVATTRHPVDGPAQSQAVRYYLSSRASLTPAQATAAVRDHWAIENKLHWHLDVTLGEDAHRLRQAQAVENLALVRKMALNLLQQDPTRVSIKKKRKRLGWNDAYLEELLTQICHQLA